MVAFHDIHSFQLDSTIDPNLTILQTTFIRQTNEQIEPRSTCILRPGLQKKSSPISSPTEEVVHADLG